MKNLIIHIGYHKTASTFLQDEIFPVLPVNYICLAGRKRKILDMVESKENFNAGILREWAMSEVVKNNKVVQDTTIMSQEELSGHPSGYKSIDPFLIAGNLKDAFPNAKIFIVIRNQFNYIKSIYAYRVAVKGADYRSFNRFIFEGGR